MSLRSMTMCLVRNSGPDASLYVNRGVVAYGLCATAPLGIPRGENMRWACRLCVLADDPPRIIARPKPHRPHIPDDERDDHPDTEYRWIERIGLAPACDVADVGHHRNAYKHDY